MTDIGERMTTTVHHPFGNHMATFEVVDQRVPKPGETILGLDGCAWMVTNETDDERFILDEVDDDE